jgi:hypothetical protein
MVRAEILEAKYKVSLVISVRESVKKGLEPEAED